MMFESTEVAGVSAHGRKRALLAMPALGSAEVPICYNHS